MGGVRAAGWEAPITVAELVNAGPLAGARMYGTGEVQVRQVRIVDELSVLGQVTPHTAVVLIGAAAGGGWAVEMAMRRAWEQAAACVIAPSGGLSAGSGEVLAERLGITLIFVDEDPLIVAVRIASAASRPEAARTQLVARCATRLAEAGPSARRVLGVLNAELPGTSVTFLDRYGRHVAGARPTDRPGVERPGQDRPDLDRPGAERPGQAGPDRSGVERAGVEEAGGRVAVREAGGRSLEGEQPPLRAAAGEPPVAASDGATTDEDGRSHEARGERAAGRGEGGASRGGRGAGARWSAEVEVLDQEGGVLGTLVAVGSSRSPGWPAAVRTVLNLAVAPLTAWAARERLRASRDFALQQALAERLLAEAEAEAEAAPGTGTEHGTGPEPGAGAAPGTTAEDGTGAETEARAETGAGTEAATGAEAGAGTGAGAGGPAKAGSKARMEGGARVEAVALGWPVEGELTGYHVRPTAEAADSPLARTLITAALGQVPVLPRGEGWAGWSALDPGELAARLARGVRSMPWPCVAGVGARVEGLRSVGESLLGAEAAAFVAAPGTVARADRMGPAELLGALPTGVLRTPAAVVLRPLLAVDKDGTLLETLAAVLDEGGALKAAERLGVHRNTVTTRLERVKSVGFDLDDAATRLALQLACHVLLR
ncbi:hypothetical protein FH608_012955 [Nonomuraea phyllanthi]|uniref:PucR C-terminal helix-turn-helix domain-containing protein n=1 Tax=Nonomuraea phyllanthi TaxID=2219224 RepID=A0A5C4WNG5_9ACTN|nr:helix-turn-helix domain-containing protein [Nonomuraea phyllanthi]KAB8195271.1 hypothetical protein FH608_012955 [Nonomuraea phyllanthi]